jgi:NAD(P)H-flavin reductase
MRSRSNNEGAIVPGSERKLTQSDYISLLFKRYPNGRFTPLLSKGAVDSLTLSEPRGEGLHLHELTPGKVVIVAGGTGLYPFSDLIDLLFKDQLRRTDPSKEALLLQLNPLLK